MKTLRFIGAAAAIVLSVSAFAQENGNRDENGKIVRGAYETTGIWDNWFVGAGVGANGSYDSQVKTKVFGGLGLDVFVGKWITPNVGFDIKYHGLKNNISRKKDVIRPDMKVDIHENVLEGNALWNISNEFSGYKETRTLDVILYGGTGLADYLGRLEPCSSTCCVGFGNYLLHYPVHYISGGIGDRLLISVGLLIDDLALSVLDA